MSAAPLVLIVDDEPDIRLLARLCLRGAGYRAADAGPEDALALAAREPPAVALLDVLMPNPDGPALLRALRAAHDAALPVVFVTALDRVEVAARMGGEGGWDYLPKPFTADELLAAVARHLSRPTDTQPA